MRQEILQEMDGVGGTEEEGESSEFLGFVQKVFFFFFFSRFHFFFFSFDLVTNFLTNQLRFSFLKKGEDSLPGS